MKPLQSLIVLLLAVALGVVGAQWLGANTLSQYGEVIFRYGGTDYRSTLPQVALLVLVSLLVLWLLWSLIASPFRAWGRYRRKQGRVRLVDGLQAYEHGHWQRAEKLFDGAAQDQEVTGVALANAARSARARGDDTASQTYLQRLGAADATSLALLRAEQLLADDLPVDAINTLDAANLQPLPPRGLCAAQRSAGPRRPCPRGIRSAGCAAPEQGASRRCPDHAGSPAGGTGAAGSRRRQRARGAVGNHAEGPARRPCGGLRLCRTCGGAGLGRAGPAGAGTGTGPALER
ncbi:heme biosynthesis HemY N-terminal domain-containing protein [Stenotrophomonas sp. SORGH_AS_0321]|uniref:heme biosynthesis HemY N-terminal domain-containing protein n=1 Tax=Stenotrophomonas sp. SORGH_AS_0321 TaxID=3041787 RepID=UPI0028607672|nr:heme biosynthesis HemY N-terminal domain-containing protein [Stenotrophomonas sp. SORGH_AS_0321]MDR6096222.1 hypothetical protein [Stenotrophomonas sp. SORGH_AS_0321]